MKKLTIYLFCICLILFAVFKEAAAEELAKTPLTHSEITVLAQTDTCAVNHITAGEMSQEARTAMSVILLAISIGLLIGTMNQASGL